MSVDAADRETRIKARIAEKDAADPFTTWTDSGGFGPLSDYDDSVKRTLEATAEVDDEMGHPTLLDSLKAFGVYPHKAMTPEQVRAKWERK